MEVCPIVDEPAETTELFSLVVIIKGDVGKTFPGVELHTENNRPRFLNEKSPNGAPLASDQSALERDFSPFNDE